MAVIGTATAAALEAARRRKEEEERQGAGERFVIGPWVSHAGGYVGDARLDGGVFFETHPEIYRRIVERFGEGSPQVQDILWRINAAPVQQAIADGLGFDYSLARVTEVAYARERDALLEYVQGDVAEALDLLGRGTMPSRFREVDLLLRAGYQPVFDDVTQVIHWLAP